MEIIKSQIQITLTKSEMSQIINEAMKDETANAAVKRVLNPFLVGKFPAFPTFTNIVLGDTAEDGSTVVTLKVPQTRNKPNTVAGDQDTNAEETEPEEPVTVAEQPVATEETTTSDFE